MGVLLEILDDVVVVLTEWTFVLSLELSDGDLKLEELLLVLRIYTI